MGNKDQIQNGEEHYGRMKAVSSKLMKEELISSCAVEEEEKQEEDEEVDTGLRRGPSTGARLWGRVRNTLLRQKVMRASLLHVRNFGNEKLSSLTFFETIIIKQAG